MEDIKKAISDIEYCIARYGKENTFTFAAYEALNQMKSMQSRIAELEKDAARLDWLEESDEGHGFCHTEFGQYRHYAYKGAVRQAIDTAMQKD